MNSVQKLFLKLVLGLIALVLLIGPAQAQDCPPGRVCVPQEQFNKMIDRLEELVTAKDAINKLLIERGTADVALASSLKVIEGWKELDAVNNIIILKKDQIITLYEKTITMYAGLVDQLEKRINKPKSAWSRVVDILKNAAILLAGIQIGRGI